MNRKQGQLPTVVRIGEVALVAGTSSALELALATVPVVEPLVVIGHVADVDDWLPGGTARAGEVRTMLATVPGHFLFPAVPTHVTVMLVPQRRIAGLTGPIKATIAQTPLVRGARVLVQSLLRDHVGRDDPAPSAEPVLIALFEAVIAEADLHPTDRPDAPLVGRIAAIIDAGSADPKLTVDAIAARLGTNRRQLYRAMPGDGIADRLSRRRIEAAADLLLRHRGLPIAEVATRSGFTTEARMRAQFLQRMGTTPGRFRADAGAP